MFFLNLDGLSDDKVGLLSENEYDFFVKRM